MRYPSEQDFEAVNPQFALITAAFLRSLNSTTIENRWLMCSPAPSSSINKSNNYIDVTASLIEHLTQELRTAATGQAKANHLE